MASEEMDVDEMDSLFEGMVLFDPSQVAVPVNYQPPSAATDDADGLKQEEQQNHQSESLPPPPRTIDESSSSSIVSQPLDENLFSDLTLITPPLQTLEQTTPDPSPTTTSSTKTISRQVSTTRKKKRAAGLRIGYKKDDSDSVLQPQSSPVPASFESVVIRIVGIENPPKQVEASAEVAEMAIKDNDMAPIDDAKHLAADTIEEEELSNRSIELKYEEISNSINEKLKRARELVDSISATRKESIRMRRKAAENLSLASARYRELEKELEEACEAEDFETADRLSDNLASADSEKESLAVALRDADADCDAVDSKMQEVLDLQIAAEEECASLLRSFATDATRNADLVLRNAEVISSNETSNWLSSVEVAEVKRMELDIESHLVNESRVGLNDSVEHVVEDDKRERDLLCRKKEELTDELEKLLALVKQKEVEISENEASIERVEKRIADAVSSFQEAQSNISTKYNSLQSELAQMEAQNEALSRKKKEIDDFLSQEQGWGLRIQELAKTSADEANTYQEVSQLRKNLVRFILESREYKVRLAKSGDKLTTDVQMLKQEISNARASLQELSSEKTSIQQETDSLKQRLLFIDKRVPELEAEKKAAASVRNFKEAARIASESKALHVEKEGIQIKMEGASSELGKVEEEISETVNRLQDTEAQLASKEKELAMTRFQMLLLIAGAAASEVSAALELGDTIEADILLGEAEVAESEARKIQSTYNFEDAEIENLPKRFISMELVSNLGGKKLLELAASAQISAP